MLVPVKNYTLTPLKIVSSRTFANFAFAVGLYTLHRGKRSIAVLQQSVSQIEKVMKSIINDNL